MEFKSIWCKINTIWRNKIIFCHFVVIIKGFLTNKNRQLFKAFKAYSHVYRPSHASGLSLETPLRNWNCRMLSGPTVPIVCLAESF